MSNYTFREIHNGLLRIVKSVKSSAATLFVENVNCTSLLEIQDNDSISASAFKNLRRIPIGVRAIIQKSDISLIVSVIFNVLFNSVTTE